MRAQHFGDSPGVGGRLHGDVIGNPLRTRAIAEAKIKTDKVDSQVLAELLRADYLPSVWRPDAETQQLRRLTHRQAALVSDRTRLKNRLHSILHHCLIPLPRFDLFSQQGKTLLKQLSSPEAEAASRDRGFSPTCPQQECRFGTILIQNGVNGDGSSPVTRAAALGRKPSAMTRLETYQNPAAAPGSRAILRLRITLHRLVVSAPATITTGISPTIARTPTLGMSTGMRAVSTL